MSAPLGGRAFEIIELLVQSAGQLVTKDELMDRVWPGATVLENTLQVHIASLRRALGRHKAWLKTDSGRGYRLLGTWTAQNHESDVPDSHHRSLPVPIEASSHNLPLRVTDLIGRTATSRRVQDLISAYRLVTLVGPGGIGKTSLAIDVARNALRDFSGGVWLTELASISDEGLVPVTLASVLGKQIMGDAISAIAVAKAIGDANLLLVLDNCEHVIGAAAELAESIVRFCPRVTVIATSQEALRIEGEQVYRVPPLGMPTAEGDTKEFWDSGAIAFLVARMKALRSNFDETEQDVPSFMTICRQLDGIPLAMEFAAARAAMFGVRQVASDLASSPRILTVGRRTALPRHRTLRGAFDWSYDLLPDSEQRLLRQLSVFPASFTLDAAEAVSLSEGELSDGISNLIAKSLLNADEGGSTPRWRLLQTVRAFSMEKLDLQSERRAASRRHAEYFHRTIAMSGNERVLPSTIAVLHQSATELDNVRTAIAWAFAPEGDAMIGIALVAAYAPVWVHLSLVNECRDRAEQALELLQHNLQPDRIVERRLLVSLGVALTITLGPLEHSRDIINKARKLTEGIDEADVQLRMLWAQWSIECTVGDFGASLVTARKFAEIADRQGGPSVSLVGDRLLGTSMLRTGRLDEGRMHLERIVSGYAAPASGSHAILFSFGQRAIARGNLARVLAVQGHLDRAMTEADLALNEALQADNVTVCWALLNGRFPVALMRGDLDAASEASSMMNDIAVRLDTALWKNVARAWMGRLHVARGEFAEGSRLLLHSVELWEQSGGRASYAELLGELALGLVALEQPEDAMVAVDRAIAGAEKASEFWSIPELTRIKGEVFLRLEGGSQQSAQKHFRAAAELARSQRGLFWELRATMSGARLLVGQGDMEGGIQSLRPVYSQFVEGLDTADVLAARRLLATWDQSVAGK